MKKYKKSELDYPVAVHITNLSDWNRVKRLTELMEYRENQRYYLAGGSGSKSDKYEGYSAHCKEYINIEMSEIDFEDEVRPKDFEFKAGRWYHYNPTGATPAYVRCNENNKNKLVYTQCITKRGSEMSYRIVSKMSLAYDETSMITSEEAHISEIKRYLPADHEDLSVVAVAKESKNYAYEVVHCQSKEQMNYIWDKLWRDRKPDWRPNICINVNEIGYARLDFYEKENSLIHSYDDYCRFRGWINDGNGDSAQPKTTSLTGRYLKAMVERPEKIPMTVGQYLEITQSFDNGHHGYGKFGKTSTWQWGSDNFGTVWQLMGEGFTPPNKCRILDCDIDENEIYNISTRDGTWILSKVKMVDKMVHSPVSISYTRGSFYNAQNAWGYADTIKNIKIASAEDKAFFNRCVAANGWVAGPDKHPVLMSEPKKMKKSNGLVPLLDSNDDDELLSTSLPKLRIKAKQLID